MSFSCSSSHSWFFFQNEDMKRYTRNSVFGIHFIWHMHRYMYKSIHMAIWNGCHIRNFDWFYQLSFFTKLERTIFWSYHRSLIPKTTWSLNCKYSLHLQTKITNLTFKFWFSNMCWYYRIHVLTFPYLSELPPNMNECRINSQWWLLSGSKHDYGLLNAPGLRSFKDIVNLDTVRRFIVCRSRGNTIPGFIGCIFIFTPTTGFRWARSLGWACNGEMTKGGRGQGGKKRKMLVIVLSYNGVIVCGVIKDMCSLFS